jgi:hypothetical protein
MRYRVKLVREIEWEQVYEAPNEVMAIDLARQEAQHGTIVDERIEVEKIEGRSGD